MVPNCVPAMKSGGLTKWFRKMGRYRSKEKRWQVSRVWKKISQWFKESTRNAYHLQKPQR